MAYFIFNKEAGNQIYKIAENDVDLNALDLPQNQYLTITVDANDFNLVRCNVKSVLPFNGSIQLIDQGFYFTPEKLKEYIQNIIIQIDLFLQGRPTNIKVAQWTSYKSFLQNLNISEIIIPPEKYLVTSLEFWLKINNKPCFNTLELP